jgi:hypothetical protein
VFTVLSEAVIAAIVCLSSAIEGKPLRQAAYDATLAECRAERWASAYRSISRKLHPLFDTCHLDNNEVLKNITSFVEVTPVFTNKPASE